MNDFEQFEAFQRSRDLVRAVADLLNRGAFSQDIALVAQLRKTMLSVYSNFGEGFEHDGNREICSVCFDLEGISRRDPRPTAVRS